MADRAYVKNAADPRQVRFAEQMEKRRLERYTHALAEVMANPHGRIVMATLIRRAGVFRSIWHPSSEIHYNAGRQDYGHELMADMIELNEDSYQLMEREQREWTKQQERSVDAAHTTRKSADQGESDGSQD